MTKTVIVTGGANGIGRAISERFARGGANVVIADPATDADRTAAGLPGNGSAEALSTDVTSIAEVRALVEHCEDEYGRIDVVVNNAGIFQEAEPTESQAVQEWQRVMDVHLRGTYLCSKFAAPMLRAQDGAAVVNLSSVASFGAFPYRTAYGPAKSAINNLTKVLAVEWANDDVRVNAVAPGYIRTERTDELIDENELDPKPIRDRTPMGAFGAPTDIGDAVAFLAGEHAGFITGTVLPIDGGWSAYSHV